MRKDKILRLFEACVLLKGYCKTILFDTQRSKTIDPPNSIIPVIQLFKDQTWGQIELNEGLKENIPELHRYRRFLIDYEYAFEIDIDEADLFPAIGSGWTFPASITNIQFYLSEVTLTEQYFFVIRSIILSANTNAVNISVEHINIDHAIKLISKIHDTCLQSIELAISKIIDKKILKTIKELENLTPKLIRVMIDSDSSNKYHSKSFAIESFLFEKIKLNNNSTFTPFIQFSLLNYLESFEHSLYFNRKLIINSLQIEPNIPIESLEPILQRSELETFINTHRLNKLWKLNKMNTTVCSDCPYSRCCIDFREPNKIKDRYYYNQECEYNPYINKWQGEEGYRSLAECGVVSNEDGFSIDHDRIAVINKELWGDE